MAVSQYLDTCVFSVALMSGWRLLCSWLTGETSTSALDVVTSSFHSMVGVPLWIGTSVVLGEVAVKMAQTRGYRPGMERNCLVEFFSAVAAVGSLKGLVGRAEGNIRTLGFVGAVKNWMTKLLQTVVGLGLAAWRMLMKGYESPTRQTLQPSDEPDGSETLWGYDTAPSTEDADMVAAALLLSGETASSALAEDVRVSNPGTLCG